MTEIINIKITKSDGGLESGPVPQEEEIEATRHLHPDLHRPRQVQDLLLVHRRCQTLLQTATGEGIGKRNIVKDIKV